MSNQLTRKQKSNTITDLLIHFSIETRANINIITNTLAYLSIKIETKNNNYIDLSREQQSKIAQMEDEK